MKVWILLSLLELPHWLMLAGTLLVIAGCIGLAFRRTKAAETDSDPTSAPDSEARPKMPLLDSRGKGTRRAGVNDGKAP